MRFGQNPMIGYEDMIGIILKNTIANITSKIVPSSSFLKNNAIRGEPFTHLITCSKLKLVWPI